MKVAVTGATGFIGNHVIHFLLEKGHSVIATSSSQEKAAAYDWFDKVRYLPLDLAQQDASTDYYAFLERPDVLIHLAWEGLPNYKEDFHINENLPRHHSFLFNLIQHGLKNLSVTGTCFEYGMREGELSEDMECAPANPYAMAKDMLRRELEQVAEQKRIHFKWIRLFYMYGPGQSQKSLISQLEKAIAAGEKVFNMSGGEQVRDFLPVTEVAKNIVAIALQDGTEGIINCCSGIPVTVKSFVEEYLALAKKEIKLNLGYYPYADYEPMRFWGNSGKLKTIVP